eukprot:TRINITY_DN12103_c1_g1_i1.p1 TRINITY_DN12103_c1_g1~~TRINITY_DN12103_c1_g1_i1.p1  ORF type:complete len:235 (+),score=-8.52 TRINITY_DN12103_c1_g1_i1:837-1541(+)
MYVLHMQIFINKIFQQCQICISFFYTFTDEGTKITFITQMAFSLFNGLNYQIKKMVDIRKYILFCYYLWQPESKFCIQNEDQIIQLLVSILAIQQLKTISLVIIICVSILKTCCKDMFSTSISFSILLIILCTINRIESMLFFSQSKPILIFAQNTLIPKHNHKLGDCAVRLCKSDIDHRIQYVFQADFKYQSKVKLYDLYVSQSRYVDRISEYVLVEILTDTDIYCKIVTGVG